MHFIAKVYNIFSGRLMSLGNVFYEITGFILLILQFYEESESSLESDFESNPILYDSDLCSEFGDDQEWECERNKMVAYMQSNRAKPPPKRRNSLGYWNYLKVYKSIVNLLISHENPMLFFQIFRNQFYNRKVSVPSRPFSK